MPYLSWYYANIRCLPIVGPTAFTLRRAVALSFLSRVKSGVVCVCVGGGRERDPRKHEIASYRIKMAQEQESGREREGVHCPAMLNTVVAVHDRDAVEFETSTYLFQNATFFRRAEPLSPPPPPSCMRKSLPFAHTKPAPYEIHLMSGQIARQRFRIYARNLSLSLFTYLSLLSVCVKSLCSRPSPTWRGSMRRRRLRRSSDSDVAVSKPRTALRRRRTATATPTAEVQHTNMIHTLAKNQRKGPAQEKKNATRQAVV